MSGEHLDEMKWDVLNLLWLCGSINAMRFCVYEIKIDIIKNVDYPKKVFSTHHSLSLWLSFSFPRELGVEAK